MHDADQQLEIARSRHNECGSYLADAVEEVRTLTERQAQLERERHAARHLERVFGTREEIQQQDNEYVSPLTSMFGRAYDRYQVAEEVRVEQRRVESNARALDDPSDYVVIDPTADIPVPDSTPMASLDGIPRTLDDGTDGRPPPRTEDELRIKLDCKICLQQRAEVPTIPCGHLVMCSYCCNIALPAKENDPTQPKWRTAVCPLCKKGVKKLARIFTA